MTREEFQAEVAFERRDARYGKAEAFCAGLAAGLVLALIIWSLW